MKRRNTRERDEDDNGFAQWGGYMGAKKSKLEEQFALQASKERTSGDKSEIFKGIAIFVNGYTVPSADQLRRIMMLHGGVYHHYERSSTTHIIASNLPDSKVKQLKQYKVVKPSWIVDSVACRELLDYRKYLLYSNQSKSQPALFFSKGSNKAFKSCVVKTLEEDGEGCDLNPEDNLAKSDIINCKKKLNFENGNKKLDDENTRITEGSKESFSKQRVRSALEKDFLSEFYNNSRLHHLSTMGATFKVYISKLREENKVNFPGIDKLLRWRERESTCNAFADDHEGDFMEEGFEPKGKNGRTVMHIDMDCFFVSVGTRNRPELRGCPVAVTHAKGKGKPAAQHGGDREFEKKFYQQRFEQRLEQKQGRKLAEGEAERKSRLDQVEESDSLSEIASCNYEARKAGVRNGMFLGTALRLCPNLKTIQYDFEGYKEVSYLLYDILSSYTLDIEAVSCDEMYVDCTSLLQKTKISPLEFATFVREEIRIATDCTASAGFGSNPLQARLATKKAKPNGQFYVEPSDVERFMRNVKVEDLPGVGHSLAYRLQSEGMATCADVQTASLQSLQKQFGAKTGQALYRHCRGIDDRPLDMSHQRKSVSAEVNYGIRFTEPSQAEGFLLQLAEEVGSRLRQADVRGHNVTLKLMMRAKNAPVETAKFMGHGACDSLSRSSSLAVATDEASMIYREALSLLRQLKVNPKDLRGMGIQITRLKNASDGGVKNTALTKFLALGKSTEKAQNKMGSALDSAPESRGKAAGSGAEPTKSETSVARHEGRPAGGSGLPGVEPCGSEGAAVCGQKSACSSGALGTVSSATSKSEIMSSEKTPTSYTSLYPSIHQTSGPKIDAVGNVVEATPLVEVPKMTLTQARKLVRAWVAAEVDPQQCDVVMFAAYTGQLVKACRLEDLDIILSLLHRCVTEKGSKWKSAYRTIVCEMQKSMMAAYGAPLRVPADVT